MALTWVATGQRAAYITDGDMRESVHFAAGLALCEAAGCTVTDLRGHGWGRGATGLIAAADAEIHAALVSLVRKYKARHGFLYIFAESSRLYLRNCRSTSKYVGERQNTRCTRARRRVNIAGLLSFRHSRLASALV